MKIKSLAYITAACGLVAIAASCEHNGIYEPLHFTVRLAASNTYRTGDPVVFEIGGNADYITLYDGSVGHEYRYKERSEVALEDIESCELEIEIRQQYGSSIPEESNLDLLVGKNFGGLNGSNAEVDRPIVEAIAANNASDWDKLPYTSNRLFKFESYKYDVTQYASNFALGLHLYQQPNTNMRSYQINIPKLTVKFKGYDPQVYTYSSFSFISFSLATLHTSNPYIHNASGNGNLKFQGQSGSNTSAQIVFQGFNAGAAGMPSPVAQWAFTQPMSLNRIAPDTGINIKGVADDLNTYSAKYTKPGSYTATFVVSNGNYQGHSATQVHEVKFTIVDPVD